jgi:16S rRNA (uracil1498-N3)-methyltransferase
MSSFEKAVHLCKNGYMTIFVPPQEIEKKERIKLPQEKSRYLVSVLRCKKGDPLSVIDGKGKAYEASISAISKKEVFIDIDREASPDAESDINLVLCQGILKGEKMDMVIQKTTELGIKEIVPLLTERCLVKETRKTKRWRKIAEEAAEQCGRPVIPEVREPVELRSWLMAHDSLDGFIFWEEGGEPLKAVSVKTDDSPIHILIGPEGGFTADEVGMAEEHGLIRTTLGRRILRAETAAIVSTALVQFIQGKNN